MSGLLGDPLRAHTGFASDAPVRLLKRGKNRGRRGGEPGEGKVVIPTATAFGLPEKPDGLYSDDSHASYPLPPELRDDAVGNASFRPVNVCSHTVHGAGAALRQGCDRWAMLVALE